MYEPIQNFLDSGRRNAWVELDKMRVYVRRATRYVDNSFISTFDIATVEVDVRHRGKGIFSRFLENLEKTLDCPLYIENVMDKRFQEFFRRRKGYVELPPQLLADCEQPACFIFTKEQA